VSRVRQANAQFKDVSVALAEGYRAIPCASGMDMEAMGIHYVNAKLFSAAAVDLGRHRPSCMSRCPTAG
jgi:hypothetical protein